MQTRMSDQRLQKEALQEHSQYPVVLLSWLRSAWFGYAASLLLVGAVVLFDKTYDYISSISMFDCVPFGLVSVLVALLWGLLPALFPLAIVLIPIAIYLAPAPF